MSKEFYKEGCKLALANAKQLMLVSILASDAGTYGIASSLNILAVEESLKALTLIMQYRNPNLEEKFFNDVYHSHTVKHSALISTIKASPQLRALFIESATKLEIVNDFAEKRIAGFKNFTTGVNQEDDKFISEVHEIKKGITWLHEWSLKESKRDLNIDSIIQWLETANQKKNSGLYVGHSNKEWYYPNQITAKEFLQERKYTEEIFDFVNSMNAIFEYLGRDKKANI